MEQDFPNAQNNVKNRKEKCLFPLTGQNLNCVKEIYDLTRRVEPHLNESPNQWASLAYLVRYVPTFTCYRIANVDRSLIFNFLAAVVIHGALQGQFEVAQNAARLKS
ncbi:hypothetical protein EVAR_31396_1 [Eumeta japonica]|uniref:Uncharacterized protein n=1 Tax=Eumeta variegata TaxID=151549 RepID=A0A4C1UXP0_EUMVA|nr:hypothetical protein EVAR_31396_1 [Eumeta japonica]